MCDELAQGNVPDIWAGVDIGKTHHYAVAINAEGKRLLSRRIRRRRILRPCQCVGHDERRNGAATAFRSRCPPP